MNLSDNAKIILKERYLKNNETPEQLFRRVARAVASPEQKYGDVTAIEEQFYDMMSNLDFLPNSPTLMNAGTRLGQLSACFVLPINDSLDSIFTTLKNTAIIHHTGGGVGFNFSTLRPKGSIVSSTGGEASGPVSFLKIFDVTTSVIKQGGKRRGASMAVLDYNHPDILEFINAKSNGGFTNFNFSVSVSDEFMRKVISGDDYWLVFNGKRYKKVNARRIFNKIVSNAWLNGEPGLLFIDEINRKHPLRERINATNPCGEQPLISYESCNLGSINLSRMVDDYSINWSKLERITRLAVRFLDNVITITKFPLKRIEEVTLRNRKIGLGVMGFADMLIKLGVPYASKEALRIADQLMSFIHKKARDESMRLGKERGSFPSLKDSKLRYKYMRNATVTTIAPTGSISLIAGCSPSIEPLFALSFTKQILNRVITEVNQSFKEYLVKEGYYSRDVINKALTEGSVMNAPLPKRIKDVLRIALEIKPEWHVRMQSVFQKHVDNSISKTINLPENATKSDVVKAFLLAYKLKCKGVTVYRYNSRLNQAQTISCGECNDLR